MEKIEIPSVNSKGTSPKLETIIIDSPRENDNTKAMTNISLPTVMDTLDTFEPVDQSDHSDYEQEHEQSWNNRIQLLLKKIGEKSLGYRWMHEKDRAINDSAQGKYELAENLFLAVAGAVDTVGFIDVMSTGNLEDNKTFLFTLAIVKIVLILIIAIIVVLKKSGNFQENATKHKDHVNKFNKINLAIQKELSLNISQRQRDSDFLKYIIETYNDVMDTHPQISDKTMENYIKVSQKSGIYKPLSAGVFEEIEINLDHENHVRDYHDHKSKKKPTELRQNGVTRHEFEMNRWLKHF